MDTAERRAFYEFGWQRFLRCDSGAVAGKRVITLAMRWALDQPGVDLALSGERPLEQLGTIEHSKGWTLDAQKQTCEILRPNAADAVGREFVAFSARHGMTHLCSPELPVCIVIPILHQMSPSVRFQRRKTSTSS
jgi:hypothetical protein